MEEKKNGSKGLAVVLLLLVILGVVGYICYDNGIILNKKTDTEEKKEKDNKDKNESKEVEVTDEELIKKMGIKTDALMLNSMNNEYYEYKKSAVFATYGFRLKALKKELSDSDKQFIVLENAKWESLTGDDWKKNDYMNTSFTNRGESEDNFKKSNKQISYDKFNEFYIEMFGKKLETPVEKMGKCPLYIYDAGLKTFFRPEPGCGGTSASTVSRYISKVTTKGDDLTVYVSIAITSAEEKEAYVYRDFDLNDDENLSIEDKDKTEIVISLEDAFKGYELNEDNYKDFSEYKVNFKKDSKGNYYFVNVVQTEK